MSKSAEHAAKELQEILAGISTNDLIQELSTREGIACYTVGEEEAYLIQKTTVVDQVKNIRLLESYDGPIRILTVVD